MLVKFLGYEQKLNSDGQQFHQYQEYKRKLKQ
jgi:hypothetical protein